jgi:hypothetical protein
VRTGAPGEAGGAGGPAGLIGSGSPRFQKIDQVLEVIDEVRVVEMRLVASERDDLSVAIGCPVVVAFGLVEPAETLVAVMHDGEASQNLIGGLLCLGEFPGVDEGEHSVGRGVQLFVAVIAQVRIMLRRDVRRGGWPPLTFGGSVPLALGSLVAGTTAVLVLLAAATGTAIIPSDPGHPANFSSKDGSLVPSRAGRRQIP